MKNIAILGSSGSIGTQTLDVVRNLNGINVLGLSCDTNIELLEHQTREFKPKVVCVKNEEKAAQFKKNIHDLSVKVVSGEEGLIEVATILDTELLITSVVGISGLVPTVEAIKCGKTIGLANKETLVAAGNIVMNLARKYNTMILPVDSEHNAIFQCLRGNEYNSIEKLILTASGGPFLGKTIEELRNVTKEMALKHPKWNMGRKISIDSATLMNKGLELIEARWLFDIDPGNIEIVIHPQSIIHSAVQFRDGEIIACMSEPDMKHPIKSVLTYPERVHNNGKRLNFFDVNLEFRKPDFNTFEALNLAIQSIKTGHTMPVVLNAANEIAVDGFLKGNISFLQITRIIKQCLAEHSIVENPSLNDILKVDISTRKIAEKLCNNIIEENDI